MSSPATAPAALRSWPLWLVPQAAPAGARPDADIEPDDCAKNLTIGVHRMASPSHGKAVGALPDELNRQSFCPPETGVRMICALVRPCQARIRRDQEVCT